MNVHGRVFVKTSVLFALIAFIAIVYLTHNRPLLNNVIYGAIVGGLFGAIFTLTRWVITRFAEKRFESYPGEVCQSRTMTIGRPVSEVVAACKNAVLAIHKAKILGASESKTEIAAKVGMSWKSFGERITLSVKSKDGDQTLVTVTSTPAVSATLIDYGKNSENVEVICRALKQRFGGVAIENDEANK